MRTVVSFSNSRVPLGIILVQTFGYDLIPFGTSQINNNPRRAKHEGLFVPREYCWKFHRGIQCPGCSYQHQCFCCEQSHFLMKCHQAKQSRGQGKNPNLLNNRSTSNTGSSLDCYYSQAYQELVPGFVYGLRLHFKGTSNGQFSSNLQSALQNSAIVVRKLNEEICEGGTRSPFCSSPTGKHGNLPIRGHS